DGNIMVPLIQGDRIGVPSVWILMGIIVGGGLFGFAGMLLAVPVFAIIYMMIKEFLEERLRRKSLPESSAIYQRSDTGKYTVDYEYTDEEREKDRKWLDSLVPKKKHLSDLMHKNKDKDTEKEQNG
ncbi:MAG: AI-2E family transporter, partial [Ruminiclostridium sp.]|nr:AI-2E family transporter [Ruminiclostridium sp.]